MHLAVLIAAEQAQHIADILPVHTYNEIIFFIIFLFKAHGTLAGAGYPVLGEFPPCGRIHGVAYAAPDLFPAGCGGAI